jgi:hypothetical protein
VYQIWAPQANDTDSVPIQAHIRSRFSVRDSGRAATWRVNQHRGNGENTNHLSDRNGDCDRNAIVYELFALD